MSELSWCQHADYTYIVENVHYRRCTKCDCWTASVYGEPSPLPPWLVRVPADDSV